MSMYPGLPLESAKNSRLFPHFRARPERRAESLLSFKGMRLPTQKLASLGRYHYLMAGLITILSCLPAIGLWYAWRGMQSSQDAELIPPWVGPVMATIGIVLLADGWILALLLLLAGSFIRKRKHRTFCLVVAAISIPHVPFASILGAFTISILMRPDVEAMFDPVTTIE